MFKKVIDIFREPEKPTNIRESPPAAKIEAVNNQSLAAPAEPETLPRAQNRKMNLKPIIIIWVILLMVIFGFRFLFLATDISDSKKTIENQFSAAVAALKEFDLDKARRALGQADSTISTAKNQIEKESIFKVAFREVPEIFGNLFSLGQVTINLADQAANLSKNAFDFIMNQRGEELIAGIRAIKNDLDRLDQLGGQIESRARALGYEDSNLAAIDAPIFAAAQLAESFVSWLDADHDQNILILFQNISEMRPTGGFVGSYAVLTLKRASFHNLEVRDIYDPDGQLNKKVVPPRPLQLITSTWGARDANWFFDFPVSAKKISQFLEDSLIYREQDLNFDAVIAINTDVIADIITVTGPIAVPDYNLIITSHNLLEAIQTEVRAGADRTQGEPKRIIKVLAPLLLDRLGQLSDAQKQELFRLLADHVRQKNIMTYARDLVIQSYLEALGAAGTVFQMPADFVGDYLAVVNANVGGAKTDAVITQNIILKSIIDLGGDIHNTLRIERHHAGDTRDEWWYQGDNQDYLQIFTPPGSRLAQIAGHTDIDIPRRAIYQSGYETDPDLQTLENSDTVFGKAIFSAWLITKIGATNALEIRYDLPARLALKQEPILYNFVFDRQSGVRGGLTAEFKAPAGYYWQESGNRTLRYENNDPPSRVEKTFTLMPADRTN